MKGVAFLNGYPPKLRTAIYTLGCKVNYFESEALKEQFRLNGGFTVVENGEKADIYVVNTCTVTHQAARKSRQLIRRLKKANPRAIIVMTGCYPQVNPEEAALLPEVDLFTGTGERLLLPELVKEKPLEKREKPDSPLYRRSGIRRIALGSQTGEDQGFLKIQDGCQQFCALLHHSLARGPLRSLAPERAMHYLRKSGAEVLKKSFLREFASGFTVSIFNPVVI